MTVDVEKALKPLRNLRKILKDFPAHPTPEQVHDLRTRARRLEATVHALSPDPDRDVRRLLKAIKPLRKAAGKVRDVDVFIAHLYSLTNDPAGEGLVRLTEHLAGLREKHARRLNQVMDRRQKVARRRIQQYVRRLEQAEMPYGSVSPAAAQVLAAELVHWPKLHANNLHEFRIRAKELRYMLQMIQGANPAGLDGLAEVKDAAGEWHDWLELRTLAKRILDAEADGQILRQISAITRDKLRNALTVANRLRKLKLEIPQTA
jgi:CHAD domain-containing protein